MTNSTPTPWNLPAFLTATLANAEANAGVGTGQTTAALQSAKEDPRDPTVAAITHFVRGRLAADSGEKARSVTEMEAFGTAMRSQSSENGKKRRRSTTQHSNTHPIGRPLKDAREAATRGAVL